MGRTRKEGSPADVATRQLDAKSKAIEKAKARQARESIKKSYKEDSESDSEIDKLVEEPADKDFSGEEEIEPSPSESGSDWDGESSGSEYGKKKSVKGRGRGKKAAAASPKKGAGRGRGRGRPAAAKGRASGGAAKNGSKKGPAPKRRRDDSDESEESEGESSGSEYGKKAAPKKRGSASRGSPAKKRATASPAAVSDGPGRRGRGRASSSKSYKEISEDDFSEEEIVVKKPAPKSRGSPKPAAKKAKKNESEDEHFSDAVSGSEDDDKERDDDAKDKKKETKGNNSKPKAKEDAKTDNGNKATKNGGDKEADTSKEEKDSDNESKKSDSSGKSDGSEKEKAKDNATLKNRTETDYSAIDFKCDKKSPSGDTPNLRVASWNIGGIKAFIKKNGLDYIKHESPDILCLQEIKCNEKTKPEEVQKVDGYPNVYWSFADQPGMHGVAILSKTEPVSVKNGLPIADDDSDDDKSSKEKFNKEGRLITAEYEKFYLINAYVPNSGRGEKTDKDPKGYPPKINNGERQLFDEFLRSHVKTLEKTKPVVLTGDLNVSHTEIDLANPKTNERTAGFTKEEREGMSKLLEETTLFDSFRKLYPDQKGAYTFWSYMHNARQKNIGWRLDYFLISEKLGDSLCENLMRNDVYGSDHCPIVLFLHV